MWALPEAAVNRALGVLVNDWTLNGLIVLASGNPYDVLESSDTQNTDNQWERPNRVAGQSLRAPHQNINNWFNTAAYTASVLQFGDSPRNPLVSPATRVVNLAVMKDLQMPFGEQQRLQIRFEAFNALNTPQWSQPDASFGDGTFGQITSTASPNRELQLALKYFF